MSIRHIDPVFDAPLPQDLADAGREFLRLLMEEDRLHDGPIFGLGTLEGHAKTVTFEDWIKAWARANA